MKIIKIISIAVLSLVLITGTGYLYASSGINSKQGYAQLGMPTGQSVHSLLSLNLGPKGVKPVRWLLKQMVHDSTYTSDVPEQVLRAVMQDLQGVQLRVYEVGDNRQVFDAAIAESESSLKEKDWQTLVSVRDDDVKVVVLQYLAAEKIAGLSIMATTSDNALFLNLIGPFDTDGLAEAVYQVNR